MEYSQLIESIVEDLLKDATSMFEPKVMKELTTPSYLSRERVANMPIKTFLKLASELRHGEEPSKKERIETALNSGEKIYEVPHLSFNIKDEIAKVTGHEGRHRALALLRRGFTHMPVSLHAKDSMSGTIRWSEANNPSHSSYVKTWPTQLIGQDQRAIVSFPVKREEGHLPYVAPQDMEEATIGFINDLMEADIDLLHATPVGRLPNIAKKGLLPAGGEVEHVYQSKILQDHSKGKVFAVAAGEGLKGYHGHESWAGDVSMESNQPVVSLRFNSKDNPDFNYDVWGEKSLEPRPVKDAPFEDLFDKNADLQPVFHLPKELYSTKSVKPEHISFFHQDTDFTPLSAHHPSLLHKLDPDKLDISHRGLKKGQMALFPLELYQEQVNKIVDGLLTEIIKANLGFGAPVSTNVRYGALFGDIIKGAREQGTEAGLRGAAGLTIHPMGGGNARLKSAISFRNAEGKRDLLPPRIYLGQFSKETGGVEAARQAVMHEWGHWKNKDVENPKEEEELKPLPKVQREVRAIATQRELGREHGVPMDPDIDQANLNTYRKEAGIKSVPVPLETEKKIGASYDLDTKEKIAIYQGKYTLGKRKASDYKSRRVISGKTVFMNPALHARSLIYKQMGLTDADIDVENVDED